MSKIILPEIGEGVEEGELTAWLVKIGDRVEHDQPVAELLTDKAAIELPSTVSGIVKSLEFKEGDIIRVGQVMVVLEGAEEEVSPVVSVESAHMESSATNSSPPSQRERTNLLPLKEYDLHGPRELNEVSPSVAQPHVLSSPSTRRLSRELGVNINRIQGTGPQGRVTSEDVRAASTRLGSTSVSNETSKGGSLGLSSSPLTDPKGKEVERVALRGIRRKIAENMQRAKWIIPHFTLMDELNAEKLVRLRTEMNRKEKITYLPFVMKALVEAVREFPAVNASIDDATQEIVYRKYYDFGFAADTPHGLMVPVIEAVDQKTLVQLSSEIVELATRAREGKLKREELIGSTVTITNIGAIGGTYATPIINHPEVAIIGMYRLYDKPIWKENQWSVQPTMNFSMTCDHRLIDGAVAARFLARFLNLLEDPKTEWND